ncbi:MAG: hypothetical protein V1804_01795 [Patescibacteria group bacterium]
MKKIIISLILFLVLSFGFLAYTETKQQSPVSQNWWVVYFSNPKDESLDFAIENNSDQNNFHWEISADKNKLKEGDINIAKGNKKETNLIKLGFENLDGKKIIIKVSTDNNSKEIYKNLQ